MPLTDSVGALFTDEWERFLKGIRQLDPDAYNRAVEARRRGWKAPGEARTINIPGWDDVVKLGPRYRPSPAERKEYYDARRQHRPPRLSGQAREAMDTSIALRERIRTSAQPEWAQGWGSILTALDNIQDLLSTLSTFGRLALWGAARSGAVLEAVSPVTGRAAIYLGAKTLGRFVPVLGWVILASDLMNLLSLAGMLATPAYGVACTGSPAALAAGIPTALLKRGLKSEVWNAARRNPFGRQARLNARARAVGKLPGFGNLLEVAQTTEQLFGYGLSFGALVGMLSEAAATPEILARGGTVTGSSGFLGQFANWIGRQPLSTMSTPELVELHRASRTLASAPLVAQYQDLFTTTEHLEALTAILAAVPIVKAYYATFEWEAAVEAALDLPIRPPLWLDAATTEGLAADGIGLPTPAAWPLPGAPRTLTGAQLVEILAPRVAAATRQFLERRRDTAEAVYAGAVIGQTTETLALWLTGSPDGVRWQLATDYRLLAGLAEDGYLLNVGDGQAKLWALWQAARAVLEASGRTSLPLARWRELCAQFDCTLIRMLPPSAAWPAAWTAPEAPFGSDVGV